MKIINNNNYNNKNQGKRKQGVWMPSKDSFIQNVQKKNYLCQKIIKLKQFLYVYCIVKFYVKKSKKKIGIVTLKRLLMIISLDSNE